MLTRQSIVAGFRIEIKYRNGLVLKKLQEDGKFILRVGVSETTRPSILNFTQILDMQVSRKQWLKINVNEEVLAINDIEVSDR
jgi:hypothetical protein